MEVDKVANNLNNKVLTQKIFTCLKSITETLEKGVEYVQSIDVVLVFLWVTLNIFHTYFYCFYCHFEQVNFSFTEHFRVPGCSLMEIFVSYILISRLIVGSRANKLM